MRVDACGSRSALAIELLEVPQDFEDLEDELLSVLECAHAPRVLLVDGARGLIDDLAGLYEHLGGTS